MFASENESETFVILLFYPQASNLSPFCYLLKDLEFKTNTWKIEQLSVWKVSCSESGHSALLNNPTVFEKENDHLSFCLHGGSVLVFMGLKKS